MMKHISQINDSDVTCGSTVLTALLAPSQTHLLINSYFDMYLQIKNNSFTPSKHFISWLPITQNRLEKNLIKNVLQPIRYMALKV